MKYSGIIFNDFSAGPGTCLTFFVQGCPHRCPGCHNSETWDFEGGKTFNTDVLDKIYNGLNANGIHRPLCIMGGEPLCQENLFLTNLVVSEVKNKFPDQDIYLWTGYKYEDLLESTDPKMKHILSNIICLIDGPYIEELRDITLPMRGSSNQRVIYLKEKNKNNEFRK